MTADRKKADALGKALNAMFRMLQNRPVPDRIRSVVDQLDEGPDATRPQKRQGS